MLAGQQLNALGLMNLDPTYRSMVMSLLYNLLVPGSRVFLNRAWREIWQSCVSIVAYLFPEKEVRIFCQRERCVFCWGGG